MIVDDMKVFGTMWTAGFGNMNDERDAVMVRILICQALGKDVSALWERFFAFGEE